MRGLLVGEREEEEKQEKAKIHYINMKLPNNKKLKINMIKSVRKTIKMNTK